jgi:hypothetical protein
MILDADRKFMPIDTAAHKRHMHHRSHSSAAATGGMSSATPSSAPGSNANATPFTDSYDPYLDVRAVLRAVNEGMLQAKREHNAKPKVVSGAVPRFEYGIIACGMRAFDAESSGLYYRNLCLLAPHVRIKKLAGMVSTGLHPALRRAWLILTHIPCALVCVSGVAAARARGGVQPR